MEMNIFNTKNGSLTLDQISLLTSLATSLEPIPEVTYSAGYAGALFYYFEENASSEFKKIYDELVSSRYGRELLNISIDLLLFEKDFRSSVISEKDSVKYNEIQKKYIDLITFNNNLQTNENKVVQAK